MSFKESEEIINLNPTKFLGELISEFSPVFQNPRFTIKDLQNLIDISYTKVNDWENKKLISGKTTGGAWRKFSIVDLLRFQIIDGLKAVGVESGSILKILSDLEPASIPDFEAALKEMNLFRYKCDFNALEYHFFLCWTGEKYYLVVTNKAHLFFLTEADFADFLRDSKMLLSSTILLPFFEYAKKAGQFLNKNITPDENTTIRAILEVPLSFKEKQILGIIQKDEFTEIKITKNGTDFMVRAKTNEQGKFTVLDVKAAIEKKDYQKIEVARVNGQNINISREETFKV